MKLLDELNRRGVMDKWLKCSFISLIPIIPNPFDIIDFRPISLLHSLYETILKLIASHLVNVLPRLISHAQGAFVEGRSTSC